MQKTPCDTSTGSPDIPLACSYWRHEVKLDRVSPLSEARLAVAATPGGYRLEAAIPWKSLGQSPEAGRLGLDLDINFSDPAGQRNTARLHWGRHGAATVYDLPTEARFEPKLWGEGIFER